MQQQCKSRRPPRIFVEKSERPVVIGSRCSYCRRFFWPEKKLRYFPKDPAALYPARKHLMRNGVIKMGPLPFTDNLDANKGIGFRIPQRDDYELVSMVKSAYLMVFSLMGANGYRFARNIGLTPIREQIMNPNQKILKSGFIVESQIELGELKKLGKSVIFLVHGAKSPFWLVPLWNNRAAILSCGASEPIDEPRFEATEGNVPIGSLAGWVAERFVGSGSIATDLGSESDVPDGSLAGTAGGPFPTSLGRWIYVSVFHQGKEFVALPLCPEGDWLRNEDLLVVNMLSNEQAIGRNLDIKSLAGVHKNPPGGTLIQKAKPSNDASK